MSVRRGLLALTLALGPSAWAYDADGLHVVPGGLTGTGAIATYGAAPASPTVSLTGALSEGLVQRDRGPTTTSPLTRDVAAHLALSSGRISALGGMSFGISAPVHLWNQGDEAPGLTPGDLRLSAQIPLVDTLSGMSLWAIPLLDLPSGDSAGWVGQGQATLGGVFALSQHRGAVHFGGHLGAMQVPAQATDQLRGGAQLLSALQLGVQPGHFGGTVELVGRSSLNPLADRKSESPWEALANLRYDTQQHVLVSVGGAMALTGAIGAPAARAMLSLELRP